MNKIVFLHKNNLFFSFYIIFIRKRTSLFPNNYVQVKLMQIYFESISNKTNVSSKVHFCTFLSFVKSISCGFCQHFKIVKVFTMLLVDLKKK